MRILIAIPLFLFIISCSKITSNENYDDLPPIIKAIRINDFNLAKELIETGQTDPLEVFSSESTLLFYFYEHIEFAKYLIEKGIDINHRRHDGVTALLLAAQDGDLAAVKLLVENGADVNIPDDDGTPIIYYSISQGHNDVSIYLIKNGAKTDNKPVVGQTLMQWANRMRLSNELKELLKNNPNNI